MQGKSKKDLIVTLSILIAIVIIVAGIVITSKKSDTDTSTGIITPATETESNPDTTTPAAEESAATSDYKDGTYTATGKYSTPEGTETITVTTTLAGGVVTDTSATASMTSRDSKEYAGAFIAGYKPQVVGKSIAGLKLSRVSGSSLTSQGFNSAITQIQTQAKS